VSRIARGTSDSPQTQYLFQFSQLIKPAKVRHSGLWTKEPDITAGVVNGNEGSPIASAL
jgi:hypothetical protein